MNLQNTMSFRKVTAEDSSAYQSIISEFRPTSFTEQQFRDTLAFIHLNGAIWVYEEEGVFLATGTILYERKFIQNICTYAHIEDICVRATHRRRGLGKALMTHLIQQCRDCYKLTLDCANENIPFYESCGLERRGNQLCQLIENLVDRY